MALFVEPRSAKNSDHLVSPVKISKLLVCRKTPDFRRPRISSSDFIRHSFYSFKALILSCPCFSFNFKRTDNDTCVFVLLGSILSKEQRDILHNLCVKLRLHEAVEERAIRVTGVRADLIRGWWVCIIVNQNFMKSFRILYQPFMLIVLLCMWHTYVYQERFLSKIIINAATTTDYIKLLYKNSIPRYWREAWHNKLKIHSSLNVYLIFYI